MTIYTLLDLLQKGDKNGACGFDAVLTDSSNRQLIKKIRGVSEGMNVHVDFQGGLNETVAVFSYTGECFECSFDERRQQTGPLLEADIRDFGMSLVLNEADHFYILNLEKALAGY